MAVLDVLSIVFDADGSKLKKGAGEAEEILEETKNTAIDTDKAAEDLGGTFLDTLSSAKGALVGLLSVGAITAAVVSQAAATDELGKFSDSIGESVEEVDAWGQANIRAGGTAEGFRDSLKSLTDNLTELRLSGSGPAAETFARLGIQATDASGKMRSAFQLLPDIAASFETLSKTEQIAFGQQLGLDQGTIQLLQQGRRVVEEQVARQKELGVATAEDAEIAATFNDALADMQQVFGDLVREVSAFLLPAFTYILQGLEGVIGFLRDHSDFVVGFFVAAGAAITAVYLPAIISAAAATLVAISPFLLIAAAVTAFGVVIGLLYDDIVAFSEGAPSLIGKVGDWFKNIFGAMTEWVTETWDTLTGFFDFITGAFLDGISAVFDKVAGFLGFGDDAETVSMEAIKRGEIALKDAQDNPLTGQTAQSISSTSRSINRQTSVSVGDVNVNAPGADSEEISSHIGTALRDEMQNTVSNFDDGVMA